MFFNKIKRILTLWFNQFFFKINNKRCDDLDSVVILKLDAIGDFIIWQDCAKEFKSIFKNKKCILLCNQVCKELAERTYFFDEVITLDIKRFESSMEYRNKIISYLNTLKFGSLVNSVFSRTWAMDVIASEIPAFKKIALRADESKLNLSRRLLTRKNKQKLDSVYDELIFTSYEEKMELQRNKDLLVGLGAADFKSSIPVLPKLSSDIVPNYHYFIVFPGASTPLKRWDPNRFANVINYVLSNTDFICIVCGGKSESYLYENIKANISEKNRILNYCGKTSVIDLIAVVQKSQFVISNDTGGIHIAAASGIPGICVGGYNNYGRFLPYITDNGLSSVVVCPLDLKCRNCRNSSDKKCSFFCLYNVIINHRFLCLDKVNSESVVNQVIKFF